VRGCLDSGMIRMGEICGRHDDDATGGIGGATGGKGISS